MIDSSKNRCQLSCIASDCGNNVSQITSNPEDLYCNLKFLAINTDGKCAAYFSISEPALDVDAG